MLTEDVLRRIRRIHFKTRHLASDLFAGEYRSAFKGKGIEFESVRAYEPGDDIRTIDWNVSARFGQPFVKVFHEERELTVLLLLDLSGSLSFGSRKRFKRDLMAEIAGMLAFLAIRTNDRVGALLFSSEVEKYIPPRKGASHAWRLIREVYAYRPRERTTDLNSAFNYLNRVIKRHAVVFLVSDCMGPSFAKSLKWSAKKHDLVVIHLTDPAEEDLPDLGLIRIEDPETGETATVNLRDKGLREKWVRYRKGYLEGLRDLLRKTGTDLVEISTAGPLVDPLTHFFAARGR